MKIPLGAIIVSSFAIVWTAAGARTLGRRWSMFFILLSILISFGVIYAGAHIAPAHPPIFNAKAYSTSVAVELVLILLAIVFLRKADRKDLLLPVISIIVGLHFFGMVAALGSNFYWWIGGAMCLWPIVTMSIWPRNVWGPVVGLGCAVILWSAAICAFF